ncbi:RNA-binding family protein [Salix suchowensis]|nr:RNA-binding family protein [Salix suchowensis]
MAINASNPKSLNPTASPYMRAEVSLSLPYLPPNSGTIVLPSKLPHLSQEIYGPYPQQLQSPLAWGTRPAPTMVAGFLANPYLCVQHQLTQAWVYQEATACYNIYKQPFTVPYSHPYYFDMGNQGTCCPPGKNLEESAAVKFEDKVKCDGFYSGALGNMGKGVFGGGVGRFVAPSRPRAKRSDGRFFFREKLWVPKTESKLYGESSGDDLGLSAKEEGEALSCSADEISLDGKTTLMIKNVPNLLGRYDLLQILDAHCLEENQKAMQQFERAMSEYDFFYLPMDFVRRANLGYAFVNFTNTDGALRFWKAFDKYKWNIGSKRKTCEVSLATIQGKDALCNRYKNSVFPCHTNTYLPVVLVPARDGWRQSAPSVVGRRVDPAFPLVERRCCGRRKSLNKWTVKIMGELETRAWDFDV